MMGGSANYQLCRPLRPLQIRDLTYSTSVNPNWIEAGDRFWYEWRDLRRDPVDARGSGSRHPDLLFDNDWLAARSPEITRDPWDGRTSRSGTSASSVEPSSSSRSSPRRTRRWRRQQQQRDDGTTRTRSRRRTPRPPDPDKKVHYFHYDTRTGELTELEDYEASGRHPGGPASRRTGSGSSSAGSSTSG
jgi:dipeptidyl-peptidase 4